jgi:hypothetical protein
MSTSKQDLRMKNTRYFRRAARAGFVIAAVAGLGACGPFHRGGAPSQTATVIFSNESIDQADVYAVVSGSHAVRIGTVFAGRTEALKVPGEVAGRGLNVNIVARLLAHRNAPSTGPLPISPGYKYAIRLPADQRQLVVLPGDR